MNRSRYISAFIPLAFICTAMVYAQTATQSTSDAPTRKHPAEYDASAVANSEQTTVSAATPKITGAADMKPGAYLFVWANRTPPPEGAAVSLTGGSKTSGKAGRQPAEAGMAKQHLARYAGMFKLSGQDISEATVRSVHNTGHGPIIVTMSRTVGGVEVFRQEMKVAMKRDMSLVSISAPVADSSNASSNATVARSQARQFSLTPQQAVSLALNDLTGASTKEGQLAVVEQQDQYERYAYSTGAQTDADPELAVPARVKKIYFQLPDHLEPAYYVEVEAGPKGSNDYDSYSYVYSAVNGTLLFRHNLTVADSYTYRVWASTTPPYLPARGPYGAATDPHPTGFPDNSNAFFTASSLLTISNSPFSRNDPWLPAGSAQTIGNNVDAYADLFAPDGYSPANGDFRASISSANTFNWPYDLNLPANASQTQQNAGITQLFYNINFLHDWYYDSGFDEASGNAQTNNYGRGGVQGDNIRAEAQDYGGTNNANMSTPADGGRPRMQMYIWSGPSLAYVQGNAPASIQGTRFTVGTAQFGPTGFNVTADTALANTGINQGCGTTGDTVSAAVAGKIAIIDRGTCSFVVKVANAQAAGAAGVVIANNAAGVLLMGGTDSTIVIPSLLVSQSDGNTLKAALANSTENLTVFRQDSPTRDGEIDNQVVAHEWGHYISNRLIGNANGLGTNMSNGLGEGWADFHAMLLTVRPEDTQVAANSQWNGTYALSPYAAASSSPTNYLYFGIRRYPYSTDMTKNPLTFKHIQTGVPLPTGIPVNGGGDNAEVHNTGEVWAQMLWECYASLLRDTLGANPRFDFQEAQNRIKDYLVAAYKVTPNNPTLLDARDALLSIAYASDQTDYLRFAAAFAKRGAGVGAVAPDRNSATNSPVVESFAVGGSLTFSSASLTDTVSCDHDGILDRGETGTLSFSFANSGNIALIGTTVTVTSDNPNVVFPNGNQVSLPSSQPFGTATGSIMVKLTGGAGIQYATFTLTANDSGLVNGQISATSQFRLNTDELTASSTTEDVESVNPPWTRSISSTSLSPWIRNTSGTNHTFLGPDNGSAGQIALVSPALTVSGGALSFTMRHRYSFEYDSTANYDGGRLEISTNNGRTWTDITPIISGVSTGTLFTGSNNPLGGQTALVQQSPSYPAFITSTVNLGTAYAGQTVRIRFLIATDEGTAANGWEVDDIAFNGLANKPFTTVVPSANACGVSWNNPADILFGSALSSEQLNATAGIPGTFTYSPAAGTVLPVGDGQSLSVVFTPADTANFSASTQTVSINVKSNTAQAQLVVTKTLSRDSSTNEVIAQIRVANTGSTTATNVVLTNAVIGSITSASVPVSLGSISGGSSSQATIRFPASAGSAGTATFMTISGTSNGPVFTSSSRVTLP